MMYILIVEDQPMVRKLLESYVEKEPEFALAASIPGANLAPELCRQQPVDLILMDARMVCPPPHRSRKSIRRSKLSL